MQDGYTGYVDKSEWWWVTLISLTFLVFIFSPFIVVVLRGPAQSGQQFMGALHNLNDSAADLARMQQGSEGKWLLTFRYTPEDNQAALVHPLYALLGQISGFLGQSPFLIYHIMRIFVGFFMYLTIYHLGASIWVKVRTRRIFFVIASAGAGFGWILALTTGLRDVVAPDLMIPQAFPLYAAAANVHYPLAIACLCLLAAIIIPVLRPGSSVTPNAENGGVVCFLAALALAFIYPDALLPIGLAFILSVLIHWGLQRKVSNYEGYWGLWILVPVLPILTYDLLSLTHNPFVAEWLQQRDRDLPSLWTVFLALGLPLLIGLPSIFRALRRFEADGDRFMLLWLLSMLILVYLPTPLGQYLLVGLMLPIGYFATRSIEDFWFNFIKRRFRSVLYIVLVPIFVLSHVFWLYLPVFSLMNGWYQINAMMLPQASSQAVLWMDLTLPNDVLILAPPNVSLWIPAWVGGRVVYGHPTETADAEVKLAAVESWYRGEGDCMSLINQYQVDYVIFGTSTDEVENACIENWELIYNLDGVRIYATEFASEATENEAP